MSGTGHTALKCRVHCIVFDNGDPSTLTAVEGMGIGDIRKGMIGHRIKKKKRKKNIAQKRKLGYFFVLIKKKKSHALKRPSRDPERARGMSLDTFFF